MFSFTYIQSYTVSLSYIHPSIHTYIHKRTLKSPTIVNICSYIHIIRLHTYIHTHIFAPGGEENVCVHGSALLVEGSFNKPKESIFAKAFLSFFFSAYYL